MWKQMELLRQLKSFCCKEHSRARHPLIVECLCYQACRACPKDTQGKKKLLRVLCVLCVLGISVVKS